MKPPEEIKKGLKLCSIDCFGHNESCPFVGDPSECVLNLSDNALAYIQQLESSLEQAGQDAKEMAHELDVSACTWCEHKDFDYTNEACKECRTYNEGFELRGLCAENTKEENE